MSLNLKVLGSFVGMAALAGTAQAVTVHATALGVVDYNVIQGSMAGTPSGSQVVMEFDMDSNNFVNSASFNVRGYAIDISSFSMTVDGRPVVFDNPQPWGTPYFVLRDNDPVVDGFFFSTDGVDWPAPLGVHIPGLSPVHELNYSRSFTNGSAFNSLNILDNLGTYGFENMGAYMWTIGRFGNPGAEYVYGSLTLSAVPEPATMAILGLGVCALIRRRRA